MEAEQDAGLILTGEDLREPAMTAGAEPILNVII
jgi:hypothetical protein